MLNGDGNLPSSLAEGVDILVCEFILCGTRKGHDPEYPAAIHKRYEADGFYTFSRSHFAAVIAVRTIGRHPDHRLPCFKRAPRRTILARRDDLFFPEESPATGKIDRIESESSWFGAGQ